MEKIGNFLKEIKDGFKEIKQNGKNEIYQGFSLDEKAQFLVEESKQLLSQYKQNLDIQDNLDNINMKDKIKIESLNYQVTYPTVNLDKDVILSKETRVQLDEAIAKLKFHQTIYDTWGFGEVDKQGRSVILNFFGEPGTGKTLTAEAFAGSLNMPIIKLGIAEIESKFMGETSKNIQNIFHAAVDSDAILFFDEADTLLGKRLSSVTQGIDNEVNSMRSTLLIELEKYNGIAIFATNFAKNYDEAFRSRISHHIHFPLPDLDARKLLWNRMLVKNIPLATDRETLIIAASNATEGFSGREIRTCMRLVLPKILLEAEQQNRDAKLDIESLLEVIKRIQLAKKEVASKNARILDVTEERKNNAQIAKNLLGIND